MRVLITGDWHIDINRPENRIDNYFESQYKKIKFIFELALKHGASIILQPGDIFQTHKANDYLKQFYIQYFLTLREKSRIRICSVYGQHDLRYHSSDRQNTPLAVLEAAKALIILSSEPELYGYPQRVPLHVYGASWNEPIPEIKNPNCFNILVTHRMIIKDDKVWDGQEDFLYAKHLIMTTGFDLIVSGDNHQSFMLEDKGDPKKYLFNCGSLMRNRIDQANHKPIVYIFDTEERTYEPYPIPVQPFEEVMDIKKATIVKERDEKLISFVDTLSKEVDIEGLDYVKNVEEYVMANELSERVESFISEVMA